MWRSFFKDKKWYLWSYGGGFFIISLACFTNLFRRIIQQLV